MIRPSPSWGGDDREAVRGGRVAAKHWAICLIHSSPPCSPAASCPSPLRGGRNWEHLPYAAAQAPGSSARGSSSAISSQSRSGGGLEAAATTADISAAEATPTRTLEASGRDRAKPSAAC